MESGREEGIENEGEREKWEWHIWRPPNERTNERLPTRSSSLSLKFSQMAAVVVYNNVLIGPKRSSVVWDLDSHLKGRLKISEEVESSDWIYASTTRNTMDSAFFDLSLLTRSFYFVFEHVTALT